MMEGATSGGGLKKSMTIKMSDNEDVRRELIEQATPSKLTTFFYERPCISIITPYILLLLFSGIAIAGDVFKMDM